MAVFSARIQGGDRLYRFITAGPTLPRDFVQAFVRQFPIGELRAAMPRRSGRLRSSLKLVASKDGVELRGVWYARFQPVVEQKFIELARRTVRRLRI